MKYQNPPKILTFGRMQRFVKRAGQALFRIWFYILVAVPIILFSPLFILFTISERTYPQFFWIARNLWAAVILYGMGCFPRISYEQSIKPGMSYVLVANHTSVLDIMMMLRVSRNPFVFVRNKKIWKSVSTKVHGLGHVIRI